MQFRSAGLPAPFGPTIATNSPSSAFSEMPLMSHETPEPQREIANLECHSSPPLPLAAILLDVAIAFGFGLRRSPKVEFTHIRIGYEFHCIPGKNDAAAFHHVTKIGDGERRVGILLNQQDGEPEFLGEPQQPLHQLLDEDRAEAERQFI